MPWYSTDQDDRLSAPVYPSTSVLRKYEGPSTDRRYAFVDAVGLFRWYLNDTTTHNGTDVIEPTGGGSVGRWKLSVAFGQVPRSKPSVDVVATSNLTLSGLQTVDGVSLTAGMIVLPARQTDKSERAPMVVSSTAWTRATWFDSDAEALLASEVYVRRGTAYAGTSWVITSPTTGTIDLGTTDLEWTPIMPLLVEGAAQFFASGDSGDDADRLEALLNAGRTVMVHSPITIDRPLVITTGGWRLIGASRSPVAIKQASTWSGTGEDSPTNAMIRLVETENATAATTPFDDDTEMGSPDLVVVSATGFSAGKFFKTLGTNSGNDYSGQSAGDNCPPEELLKVASIAGTTITHALPQTRHIGKNNGDAPFRTIKLLDAVVEDVVISNIKFDAYQDGTAHPTLPAVACGIAATFSRLVKIENCQFKGFTYAAIYARGCREWVAHQCDFLGANNGRIRLFSCQNFTMTEMHDRLEVRVRHNTNDSAAPQYAWVYRSQCHAIRIQGSISCAAGAILAWGGDHCEIDAMVEDVDFTALHTTPIADDTGGRRGYVLDTNANDVPTAEFGRCNKYDVRWSNCHSGTAKYFSQDIITHWHAAVYLHDVFDCDIKLRNTDLGSDPETATQLRWLGIVSQDCTGRVDADIRGFVKGFACIGTYSLYRGSRYVFDAAAGNGSTGLSLTGREATLLLDEGSGGLPHFSYIRNSRTYHTVEIYSSFAFPLSCYKRVLCHHIESVVIYDSAVYEARDVIIARMANAAVYPGICSVLPIDDTSASTGEIRVSATPSAAPATGTFITLTYNVTAAGATIRPIVGVLGGIGAVCPVYGAASQTFGARSYVEVNNLGHVIPATNGADHLATLARIVGRARHKFVTTSAAFMQLG